MTTCVTGIFYILVKGAVVSVQHSFISSFILTLVTGKLHSHVSFKPVDDGLIVMDVSDVNKIFININNFNPRCQRSDNYCS